MAWTLCKASTISSVIFYLIQTTRLCSASESKYNCSLPCGGPVQSILFPLRLRGAPPNCGDPDHELICDGKQTTLELHGHKFHVTHVNYTKKTMDVVSEDFASGNCSLPDQFLLLKDTREMTWHSPWFFLSISWISFLNCSEKIAHDEYWIVPCLGQSNNTYIYATYGTEASILLPSCSFVGAVPTSTDKHPLNNVFEHLQQGFHIGWNIINYSLPVGRCLREALMDFKEDLFVDGPLYLILSRTSSWMLAPLTFGRHFRSCITGFRYQNEYNIIMMDVIIGSLSLLSILLVLAQIARFVLCPMIVFIFLAHKYWTLRRPVNAVESFLRNQQALSTKRYAYTDITAITAHFHEKLGQGGFGSVFKGELPGGRLIAVKMLNDSGHNGEEFINEVSTIGRIHHVNVVQLVGFCAEGSKRALVYDYMPNGSLDKYIFSSDGTIHRPFSWDKLNDMALCIARGIDYLHRGCEMRILHFDIKPHNILLDHNFNPKISDFGLARLCPKTNSMVTMSAARGTIGYMAPELISRSFGVISYKSDVYSFGMLLMEMAAGRRNVNPREQNSSQIYYPSYIYDQLNKPEILEVTEGFGIGATERKLYKVGLCCIQMRPTDRPSMSEVVEMLQGDATTLQMPPKPFFTTLQPASMTVSCSGSSCDEISIISGS